MVQDSKNESSDDAGCSLPTPPTREWDTEKASIAGATVVTEQGAVQPGKTEGITTSKGTTRFTRIEKWVSEHDKTSRIMVFIGLQLSLFLSALDSTIISTSLPSIGSDFNQMSIVAWVSTAYLLSFDGFQPLFSKFSDIFGRKLVLVVGIVIFLFASALCGASQSITMLIAGRAIQGIGAAGSFSMVFVIISDIVPLEKRGSYQGYSVLNTLTMGFGLSLMLTTHRIINAVFAMASIFGPLLGGSLTDYASWRWNFYINLPFGAAAFVLIVIFLRLPEPEGDFMHKLRRIDYFGTFNVLAFSTLFLLAMNFGGQTFPWRSAAVIVPLCLSVVMVGLLILVEIKFAKEPLMPPRLFKVRSIVAILATNWFFGITFFSIAYYLPVYMQIIKGDSAMWSGIRMMPMQFVATFFASASGFFISKTGIYRPLITIGTAILTICTGLLSMLDKDTGYDKLYGFTALGGVGLGLIFSAAIIGLQAAAEPRDIAVVTGLGNFSRILGGALGVSISAAILNSSLNHDLPGKIPDQYIDMVIKSPESLKDNLPLQYFPPILDVYMDSIQLIWYVMIPMSGVAFLSSLFVKHHPVLKATTEEGPCECSPPSLPLKEHETQQNKEHDRVTVSVDV